MNRRNFLHSAGLLAVTVAVPASAIARALTGAEPFREGERFQLEDGCELVVDERLELGASGGYRQFGVRFSVVNGSEPGEGLHRLRGTGGATELFLQQTSSGPLAWFSQVA